MRNCPRCGQQLADGTAVCPYCGLPLTQQQPQYQQAEPQPRYQQAPQYQQAPPQPQYQQPQYRQPPYPPYAVPVKKPKIPGRGFGITSMVLGIIASVISLSCIRNAITLFADFVGKENYNYLKFQSYYLLDDEKTHPWAAYSHIKASIYSNAIVAGILAVLAIIFAIIAISVKKFRKGQSIAGLILGIVAALMIAAGAVMLVIAINDPNNMFEKWKAVESFTR